MTKNASCEELNQVKEVETLAKEGESPVNLFSVFIEKQIAASAYCLSSTLCM